uniref:histidine kinase n=1 Tax=Fundidesulfovibrio putealis TaxID=270496 RepID=A0A7C4AHG0_9BACT
MPDTAPPRVPTLSSTAFRYMHLIGFGAVAVLVCLLAFTLLMHRQDELESAATTRALLARVADARLSSSLKRVDNILDHVVSTSVRVPDIAQAELRLHDPAMYMLPELVALVVTDAAGIVRATTNPALHLMDMSARSFFTVQLQPQSRGFFLSEPFASRTGGMIIVASRPIILDDGRFAGVAAAGLRTTFFENALSSITPPAHGRVALLGEDRLLRLRVPDMDGVAPSVIPDTIEGISRHFSGRTKESDIEAVGLFSGSDRLITLRTLEFPDTLAVVVSQGADAVLEGWRHNAALISTLGILASLLILCLAYLARQVVRRAAETDARQRKRDTLFAGLLRNLPVECWARNRDGQVIFQNDACMRFWGDLHDKPFDQKDIPQETLAAWASANRRALSGETFSHQVEHVLPSGERRLFEAHLGPMRDDAEVTGILGVNLDVTDKRRAEEGLRASLAEKEVLLKEIHHRVKNNLQVILSLINLQANASGEDADHPVLRRTSTRIFSMALIHEQLYQSSDLTAVDMAGYIPLLAERVAKAYSMRSAEPELIMDLEGQDLRLSIEKAIPLGLILNELLSNAFKHALPQGGLGRVRVDASRADGRVSVEVSDDGPGMPEGFDPDATESLGMQLITSLTRQIGGQMTWWNDRGAHFRVTFPG